MRRALVLAFALAGSAGCDDPKKPAPTATSATTTKASSTATATATASSPAPTSTPSRAVDPRAAAACDAYAAATCAKMFACVATTKALFADEGRCKLQARLDCMSDVGAPDADVSADLLASCTAKIAQTACGDFSPEDVAECRAKGKRATGAVCGSHAQCESTYCDYGGEDVRWACGKCVAAAKEGESCKAAHCAPGLRCAGDKCVKPAALGAACGATAPCHNASCIAGKCAAYLKAGDACDPAMMKTAHCDGAAGLGCDGKLGKCVGIQFAKPGEDCGEIDGAEDKLCSGGRCVNGKCAPLAERGGACKSDHDCILPTYCSKGSCAMPDPASCK